MTLTPQICK